EMPALLRRETGPVVRIVTRSCEIKAAVVAEDEQEADRRRILNYGHTIGHALESLGGYGRLIHGEAVGIGMVCEASLAQHLGACTEDVVTRQRALVRAAGLPDELPPMRFSELWAAMQHDKKVAAGQVYCVLPRQVGRVVIAALERAVVKEWFAAEGRRRPATGRTKRVRRRSSHPRAMPARGR